jgi:hypothetical protein
MSATERYRSISLSSRSNAAQQSLQETVKEELLHFVLEIFTFKYKSTNLSDLALPAA